MLEDKLIFLSRPVSTDYLGIQHVVPSFAALPSESPRKVSGDDDPVLGSQFLNLAEQHLVFLRRPLTTLVLG